MTEQEETTEEQLPPPAASYRSPEPGEMAGSYHREDSAGTIKVKNKQEKLFDNLEIMNSN